MNSKKVKELRKEVRTWMLQNQIPLSLFKVYMKKAKNEIKRKSNEKYIKLIRDKRTISKTTLVKNSTKETTSGDL